MGLYDTATKLDGGTCSVARAYGSLVIVRPFIQACESPHWPQVGASVAGYAAARGERVTMGIVIPKGRIRPRGTELDSIREFAAGFDNYCESVGVFVAGTGFWAGMMISLSGSLMRAGAAHRLFTDEAKFLEFIARSVDMDIETIREHMIACDEIGRGLEPGLVAA